MNDNDDIVSYHVASGKFEYVHFKTFPWNNTLPNPDRTLSIKVPSETIAAANRKTSEAIEKQPPQW